MNKVTTAVVLTLLFGAHMVFAQSYQAYYPTPTSYQQAYVGSCISISRDLSVGSRGSDVLQLQKFILNHNYPGAGSWILTSYFGQATRAGVINLQIDSHLPQTGILDAQTRAALTQMTCGYGYNQPAPYPNSNQYPWTITQPWYNYNNYTYGTNYTGNCSNVYGSTCQCGWNTVSGYTYSNVCNGTSVGNLNISYLSPNSGSIGTTVTIYGNGFSSTNNSVRFGNGVITNLNSTDGRSLTFVVPSTLSGFGYGYVTPGSYNVSVTDSSGMTSNALPFTVNSYGNGGNYNAPSISNVSGPTSLQVNTNGTWIVSINYPNNQFNNYATISVNWGDPVYGAYLTGPQQLTNISQSATFTHAYSQAGTYTVTFTVSNSYGSNSSTITVHVGSYGSYGAPTISSISPTYGPVGTQITIYGSGFNGDNVVHFGNGGAAHVTSASGNYIYFTVPSSLTPCTVQVNGSVGCPQYAQQVTPGQYNVYITTNGINSNSLTFTVQ